MKCLRALLGPLLIIWGMSILDSKTLMILVDNKLSTYPFYLGVANYEIVLESITGTRKNQIVKDGILVINAVRAFSLRANMSSIGNPEEVYCTIVKLGEISSGFFRDNSAALAYFNRALQINGTRPDPLFHLGEIYHATGQLSASLGYLTRAAVLPLLNSSLLPAVCNQLLLQNCLVPVELARVALDPKIRNLTSSECHLLNTSLRKAMGHCPTFLAAEINRLAIKFNFLLQDKNYNKRCQQVTKSVNTTSMTITQGSGNTSPQIGLRRAPYLELDEMFRECPFAQTDPSVSFMKTIHTHKARLMKLIKEKPPKRQRDQKSEFNIRIISAFLAFFLNDIIDFMESMQTLYLNRIVFRRSSSGGSWFQRMDLLEYLMHLLCALQTLVSRVRPTCKEFRRVYQNYTEFVRDYNVVLVKAVRPNMRRIREWRLHHARLGALCL